MRLFRRQHPSHPSDDELLRFTDLELAHRAAHRVREHLDTCLTCTARSQDLRSTLSQAIAAHETENRAPEASGARMRLQAAMREETGPTSPGTRQPGFRALVSAGLSLALIVSLAWLASTRGYPAFHATHVSTLPLPSRALTPGSLRTVSKEDVCRNAALENDPPVSASTMEVVFSRYAVPAAARSAYAMDYLIAPSLGGDDNANNIWPEPASSDWNATDKDRLEDHLHTLVCAGQLPLSVAQNDLATDWIAAYRKYFRADAPGSAKSGAPLNVNDRAALFVSPQEFVPLTVR